MKTFFKYAAVAAAAALVTFCATTLYNTFGTLSKISSYTNDNGYLLSKLAKINTYLEKYYLYDDYDFEKMSESAIAAYVDALDEPYTHYYTENEFNSYLENVEDSYVGIGVVITADEDADKIMIIAPMEDSPARESGLLPGDYIIAVDETAFGGSELDECVRRIKSGKAGTTVTLTIERGGEITDYVIERREILAHSVKSEMLSDNIGYMRITAFNTNDDTSTENTYTEFLSQIEQLKSGGMQKLVIDLRDNPGGVVDVVCSIADYLLPEGTITYTETKDGKRETYSSDASELDMPIAVLINENSASASEILTGALKDYNKAVVVGKKSFGKGIVQTVYPFSDGSGMSITIAKYYTPNGVCIHGIGIEPDYDVSLPEEYENSYIVEIPQDEDTQLTKALELLK